MIDVDGVRTFVNHGQKWTPDTCGCSINLAFDDTLPPDRRESYYITEQEWEELFKEVRGVEPQMGDRVITRELKCSAHLKHSAHEHHAVLLVENRMKNHAMKHIRDVVYAGDARDEASVMQDVVGGATYRFEGESPDRTLRITHQALRPEQVAKLQGLIRSDQHTAGRVVVG